LYDHSDHYDHGDHTELRQADTHDRVPSRDIPNPAIVLDRDFGRYYALAFTDKGIVRGAVCKSRPAALADLELVLTARGARL
jgi:hypothetical protein